MISVTLDIFNVWTGGFIDLIGKNPLVGEVMVWILL
jgi:hypothetical protein